ncbi:MAG: DUF2892 domain-containing protein [Candidatus Cloacimonadaceae bacterium]|nr:DUF2892 domain-containing protein [Candidatus Cloacimonadaceae bacterium]
MKKNIGTTDMIIRIAIALAFFAYGLIYKSCWGLIGVLPLLTGINRFCLLYTILGIKTCKLK